MIQHLNFMYNPSSTGKGFRNFLWQTVHVSLKCKCIKDERYKLFNIAIQQCITVYYRKHSYFNDQIMRIIIWWGKPYFENSVNVLNKHKWSPLKDCSWNSSWSNAIIYIAVTADSERKEPTERQHIFLYHVFSTKDVIQLFFALFIVQRHFVPGVPGASKKIELCHLREFCLLVVFASPIAPSDWMYPHVCMYQNIYIFFSLDGGKYCPHFFVGSFPTDALGKKTPNP